MAMSQTELEDLISRLLGKAYTRVVLLDGTEQAVYLQSLANKCGTFSSLEVLGSLPLTCCDIRKEAQRTHKQERALLVNASNCSAFACAAIRLGADLCFERLEDICGSSAKGIVAISVPRKGSVWSARAREVIDRLPQVDVDKQNALLLLYRAYEKVWHESSDVALAVAAYLVAHPVVKHVYYPGLLRNQNDSSQRDQLNACAPSILQGGFGPYIELALAKKLAAKKPAITNDLLNYRGPLDGLEIYRLDCRHMSVDSLIGQLEILLGA
ncbi:hypothetical protein HMPREF9069_01308 [Atopobium sp. oral taxon 810 str. F0209]|nr:hypothetical protein HMPREF9069_01308 [Atopobium sp. oral taxon 810 str. F0209]